MLTRVISAKPAPDVGVGEEISHYYFGQLVDGMVGRSLWQPCDFITFYSRAISTVKASATGISSQRIFY